MVSCGSSGSGAPKGELSQPDAERRDGRRQRPRGTRPAATRGFRAGSTPGRTAEEETRGGVPLGEREGGSSPRSLPPPHAPHLGAASPREPGPPRTLGAPLSGRDRARLPPSSSPRPRHGPRPPPPGTRCPRPALSRGHPIHPTAPRPISARQRRRLRPRGGASGAGSLPGNARASSRPRGRGLAVRGGKARGEELAAARTAESWDSRRPEASEKGLAPRGSDALRSEPSAFPGSGVQSVRSTPTLPQQDTGRDWGVRGEKERRNRVGTRSHQA